MGELEVLSSQVEASLKTWQDIIRHIGSKRIAGKIFLAVSSIVILHLLLLFLLVFDPTLLPSFLTKYAAKCSEWIFRLTLG
jgi:hypothetical protein